jgi:transposase-like protein
MRYRVVEKDTDEKIGFIHLEKFKDLKKAKQFVKELIKDHLGTEYYQFIICEEET